MQRQPNRNRGAAGADVDEILPEYDFRHAKPNKYAARYAVGSSIVVLEPDVAALYPTARKVNEALRTLAGISGKQRIRRTRSSRIG